MRSTPPMSRWRPGAHEEAIRLYETEARNGRDSQLRAFAAHALPTLKAHRRPATRADGGGRALSADPRYRLPPSGLSGASGPPGDASYGGESSAVSPSSISQYGELP